MIRVKEHIWDACSLLLVWRLWGFLTPVLVQGRFLARIWSEWASFLELMLLKTLIRLEARSRLAVQRVLVNGLRGLFEDLSVWGVNWLRLRLLVILVL